jgi:hypothetical protein
MPPAEPYASIEEPDPGELIGDDGLGLGIDSGSDPIEMLPLRPRRANSVTVLLALSAMVALGGVSFAVGRMVSAGANTAGTAAVAGANGQPAGGNGLPGLAANPSGAPIAPGGKAGSGLTAAATTVSGTVVGVSSSSITVQQANGQTVTIGTDTSTSYHSQTSATISSVTTGAAVIVQTSGRSGFGRERGGISAGASPGLGAGIGSGLGGVRAASVTILSPVASRSLGLGRPEGAARPASPRRYCTHAYRGRSPSSRARIRFAERRPISPAGRATRV